MKSHLLNLGELRKFLEQHKDAPDELPVQVSIPNRFNCEDEFQYLQDRLTDEDLHDPNEYTTVNACNILFTAFEEGGGSADSYIPPEEREGEDWVFGIEIVARPEEVHDILVGECPETLDEEGPVSRSSNH